MDINETNNNIIYDPLLLPNGFNSPNFLETQPSISNNNLVKQPSISNNNLETQPSISNNNNLETQPSISNNNNLGNNGINLNDNINNNKNEIIVTPAPSNVSVPSETTITTDILNEIAGTRNNKIERNNEKLKKEFDKLPIEEKKHHIIKNEIMQIIPLSLLIVLLIFILLLIYVLTY